MLWLELASLGATDYMKESGPGITNVLTHLILCLRKKMAIVCNH